MKQYSFFSLAVLFFFQKKNLTGLFLPFPFLYHFTYFSPLNIVLYALY